MAGKENQNESAIDKTTFFWVGLCGICHPGGGPGEYDRDNELLYDPATLMMGYEKLGKTDGDVVHDGDYSVLNHMNGDLKPAPWNVTGVAEADCMLCHRADRTVNQGMNMNWIWRAATLRGREALQDAGGGSVAAYAAAATASQGWFSALQMNQLPAGMPPQANTLQIDYEKGLSDGSLYADPMDRLYVSGLQVQGTPKDYACWGCHLKPEIKKRGRIWFDPNQDVHYAAFNNLRDGDPDNDVAAGASTACSKCHPSGIDHNIAKGNATLGSVDNHLDYVNFRTCWDCHSADSPQRESAAPIPNDETHSPGHLRVLSCEACHVPYKTGQADLVVDNATTGKTMSYSTSAFLSADPLDPTGADKSRWYPSFVMKKGRDGVERMYPVKLLMSAWWGDWDQATNAIKPIALWRVRSVTGGQPLTGVTDDNLDGKPEVNRLAEIKTYIDALKAPDKYNVPIAANPVLVRGGHVWYEDPNAPEGVSSFEYHGTGIKTESSHPFSINHNVQPRSQALGAIGCMDCHKAFNGMPLSPVFDRLILVDPFGPDGQPVYKTVRELTGVNPP